MMRSVSEKLVMAWMIALALIFCGSLGTFMWVIPLAIFAQVAAGSVIALVLSFLLALLIDG